MLSFRDMTFCKYYNICKRGNYCSRALTDEVIESASKSRLPICQFSEKPDCYKEDSE